MYLRGFDRRGAAASLNNATSTGFQVTGNWADIADFAVLVLQDADDLYGHLQTTKYLPDFNLTGVVVDFDVAATNCVYPGSAKNPAVAWDRLSYINSSEAPGSIAVNITSTTGMVAATQTYTVAGACTAFDVASLIYLGNVRYEYTIPAGRSITYSFFGGHPLAVHSITIGSNTYTFTEASGGGSSGSDIANGLRDKVNGSGGSPDPNCSASSSSNSVTLIPAAQLGTTVTTGASDGNGAGTIWVVTNATDWVANQLAAQINAATGAASPFTAVWTATTSSFVVTCTNPGTDGNTVEMLSISKAGSVTLSPSGNNKFSGGVDPTAYHVKLDFSAMSLTSLRQCWLTLAPPLPIDTSANDSTLKPFVGGDFSYVVTNWTVTDPSSHTPLKIAGPGSVTVGSLDTSWVTYGGTSWQTQPTGAGNPILSGNYYHGFDRISANAGDSVTINYSCQHVHDLMLGSLLYTSCGKFHVTLDGATLSDVDMYCDTGTPIASRRTLQTSVAAGTHVVKLTVSSSKNGSSSGFNCVFDFLQAAVRTDVQDPPTTSATTNVAMDYDTDQTYKVSPARALWTSQRMGFTGDIDFYAGVFFGLKRVRQGGYFHSLTVTLGGSIVAADAVFIQFGGTYFGDIVIPNTQIGVGIITGDTFDTVSRRFCNAINALFVGIYAVPNIGSQSFTVTSLSPIYTFTFFTNPGASITISNTGDVLAGNEGVWGVDATQASPLNKAFADYLLDFCTLAHSAGQTVTVAYSQELLAPPDANTSGGAWSQRYPSGNQVLTSTGFGFWGAGVVEANASGTIKQTAHGYISGNIVHIASGSSTGVWQITVTDADHYQLTTLRSGGYTPGVGDNTFIELQTTQCAFNPSTVTPYMAAYFKQTAGIMSAAGLTPWLQLGEILHWFYSEKQNVPIAFVTASTPVAVTTTVAHGLSTGQRVVIAGGGGTLAIYGRQTITVTSATSFTVDGSTGGGSSGCGTYIGSWVGGGTVSGGGMAYYDANQTAAATVALGRALGSFWTQDDDPTVSSSADANFLAARLKTHCDTIISTTKASYAGAKFEVLWPYDVNYASCYFTANLPYPQGGRMNRAVNLPSAWNTKAGSNLDRMKTEGLSWSAFYRDNTKAAETVLFPYTVLSWSKSDTRCLIPWFNGGCHWPKEYLFCVSQGTPVVNFWAFDHAVLLSWPTSPLPAPKRRVTSR